MKCETYDKKVRIERLAKATPDAHGHVSLIVASNWEHYCDAWCSCVSKGGREFWKVQQVNADVTHVWRSDWSKTLAAALPSMRLIYEGNTYEIISVEDVDLAHQQVEIQTKRAI